MIAWPLYAEQRMNATVLAEDVGVAIKASAEVGRRVIGREEIEKVVRMAVDGEGGKVMRSKARELKESASRALNFGGPSHEALAGVVNEWKFELKA